MTDAELIVGAISTVGGSLGLTLRWAVNRVTKSNDDGTAALIANTASNAVLIVKIDQLVSSNAQLAAKIDGVSDFVEEYTPIGRIPKKPRANTDPIGVGQYRQHRTPRKDDE